MNAARLRALLIASDSEIDCAMNSLVWAENKQVMEDLSNARELIKVALESLGDPDDPEELDFE